MFPDRIDGPIIPGVSREVVRSVLAQYSLPRLGVHGLPHWARVLENATILARSTGADLEIVQLFAVLHDCQRMYEGTDPRHGRRAAQYARRLRGSHFELGRERFDLLAEACAGHTDGRVEADVTIQTCWDADRLDLPRVGIEIDPRLLCTEAARDQELIAWASKRAVKRHRPDFLAEWT